MSCSLRCPHFRESSLERLQCTCHESFYIHVQSPAQRKSPPVSTPHSIPSSLPSPSPSPTAIPNSIPSQSHSNSNTVDIVTAGSKVKRANDKPSKNPSPPSKGSGGGWQHNDDITTRPIKTLLTTSRAMKKNISTSNRSKTSRAASGSSEGEMRPRDVTVKERDDSGDCDGGGDMGGETAAATSGSGGGRGRRGRGRGVGREMRLKKKEMTISDRSKEREKVVKGDVATSWSPDCSDEVVATKRGRKRGRAADGGRGRERREVTGHKDQPHTTTTLCDDGDSIGQNGQTTAVRATTTGCGVEVGGKGMESHCSGGREEGRGLQSPTVYTVTPRPQAPKRAGENSHLPARGRGEGGRREKRTLLTTEEAPSSKRPCISSGYLRYDVMMM